MLYKYRFGIRMCSIPAKCWKSSEMAKKKKKKKKEKHIFAHFIEFVPINPHSTKATPKQYPI